MPCCRLAGIEFLLDRLSTAIAFAYHHLQSKDDCSLPLPASTGVLHDSLLVYFNLKMVPA